MAAGASSAIVTPYGTSGGPTYVTVYNPNNIQVSINMVAHAAT